MTTTVPTLDPRARSLVERAVAILREHGATEVYVYGSVTTDRWDPEWSDIDFAVRGLAPGRYFKASGDVVSGIGHEIDLLQLDRGSRLAEFLQEEGDLVRVG
jgi:predicted nucleotidyltransferase